MLADGRLRGVKIGQQWRFPSHEVNRLLGQAAVQEQAADLEANLSFPTHCVQTIQELFSEVGQVSALVIDLQGKPLTTISRPCSLCRLVLKSPSGREACQQSWKEIASRPAGDRRPSTCHAGLQYLSAPVNDQDQVVGHLLAGQFLWSQQALSEEQLQDLASKYNLKIDALRQAASEIPVIPPAEQTRVKAWPFTASKAVESILHERSGFMDRLQQIANLTQI
jgi:ligand-binding sensor protein